MATRKAPDNYTKPALREKLKQQILDGDKGGKSGQWSARKAQLLAQEYEKAGGGYKGPKTETQKSLEEWTAEEWTTADGKKAVRAEGTARYLPKKAWDELTPAQKASTNRKKKEGSREGKQFVANTEAAAGARKKAVKATAKKRAAATANPAPASRKRGTRSQ